jgi:positive regulator of sigma E activity
MGLFRRKANPEQPKLPLMQSAIIALLRHLLTFIGGTLVAKGILDSATLQEIIGALITLLSVGWMAVEKVKAKPEAPKA